MKKILISTLMLLLATPAFAQTTPTSQCPNGTTSCTLSNQSMGDVSNGSTAEGTQSLSSNAGNSNASIAAGNTIDPNFDNKAQTTQNATNTTTGTISGGNNTATTGPSSATGNLSTNDNHSSVGNTSTGASTSSNGSNSNGSNSNGSNSNGANTNGNNTMTGGSNSATNTANGGAGGQGGTGGTGGNSTANGGTANGGAGGKSASTSSSNGTNAQGQGQGQSSTNANGQSSANTVKGGAQTNGQSSANTVGQGQTSSNSLGQDASTRSGSDVNVDASDRSSSNFNEKTIFIPAITPPTPPSFVATGNIIKETLACGPRQVVVKTPIEGKYFGFFKTKTVTQGYTDELAPELDANGHEVYYKKVPYPDGNGYRILGSQPVIISTVVGISGARNFAAGGNGNGGASGQIGGGASASMNQLVVTIILRDCDLGSMVTERVYVPVPTPTTTKKVRQ